MEKLQVDTRHTELHYWSVIEEIQSKKISVRNMRGFTYLSSIELTLWEDELFHKESIPFYVMLDELKKIHAYILKRGIIANDPSKAKERLLFILRISALMSCAGGILQNTLAYSDKNVNDKGYHLGWKSLATLSVISKNISDRFAKEINFTDPNFFIKDIFSSIKQALASTCYSKAIENFEIILELLDDIDGNGFYNLFYDFSGELRKKLINGSSDHSEYDKQVAFFSDGFFWVDNELESSAYTLVFGKKMANTRAVMFVELMRLYFKQKQQSIDSTRTMLISQLAKKTIESKTDSVSFLSLSAGAMGGYDNHEINIFLARLYNTFLIDTANVAISGIIDEEIIRHRKHLYMADSEASISAHRLIFSAIIEKISSLLSQNQATSLMFFEQNRYTKEEFVQKLSTIIRDSYIQSVINNKQER